MHRECVLSSFFRPECLSKRQRIPCPWVRWSEGSADPASSRHHVWRWRGTWLRLQPWKSAWLASERSNAHAEVKRKPNKTPATKLIQLKFEGGVLKDVALYLKEGGGLGNDACDLDLRLQREWDRLKLRKVHLLVVGQEGLQPLRLCTGRKERLSFNYICRINRKLP